ncbi:malonic semialdehyde reductase [Rhizobiales bacterium TNE-4]|nr:malonic semialdehyde reductase [Rhizobiales bacterium TNE-4]MBV1828482.1 malonic semialdehyde reductase [Rhizobiales bacterium TNE-4]
MFDTPLSDDALRQLFLDARTHNAWTDKPVSDGELERLVSLMLMAPTSVNALPARIIFVRSKEAKEKLRPALSPGNVDKTMAAPVTAIIGYDTEFHQHLPKLFPHADAKSWFDGKPDFIEETAFRNSSLQGGYLILAARALGLDCGAMSGFNKAAVEKAFFPDGKVKANFLCNIGHGDPKGLFPRSPRHAFADIAKIV